MGRGDQFSYEAKSALFEYLEEYEQDTETEIELDVIALCCDYSEHENIEEWAKDYFGGTEKVETEFSWTLEDDEIADAIRDYINENGQLIEFDGGIIVSSF